MIPGVLGLVPGVLGLVPGFLGLALVLFLGVLCYVPGSWVWFGPCVGWELSWGG